MSDTTSDPWLWFLSRGAGITALVLLTISVVVGIFSAGGWRSRSWPRFVSEAVHRSASLLAIAFVVVHIVTIELHVGNHVEWGDAVLPFGARFRPVWMGLGTIAGDVSVALVVSSALRRFIGGRMWRVLHWAGYAAWLLAIAHGLGAGTDAQARWSLAISGACVGAVLAAVFCRVVGVWSHDRWVRHTVLAVTLITVTQVGLWAVAGPLAPDWAHHVSIPSPAASTAQP